MSKHRKQLLVIGIGMVVGIVVCLGGWVALSGVLGLEVERTCRYAGVTVMVLLFGCFVLPLFLRHPVERRIRGWIVFWFTATLAFDLFWQIPLWTIPVISAAEVVRENLWWAIFWWAYTLTDAVYKEVTPMMVAFEIWWLLGNIVGLVGLLRLWKGDDLRGFVLVGVCGALQCYNASVYLFVGVFVDRYEAVATDVLGQLIYWGLNGFWAVASCCASVLAFRMLRLGSDPDTSLPGSDPDT
jgi:hypothetical protein